MNEKLVIYTDPNNNHLVIAESVEEAMLIYIKTTYNTVLDTAEAIVFLTIEEDYEPGNAAWKKIPDNKVISFVRDPESGAEPEYKPAREWVKEYGKGYFGCEDWD